MTRIHRLGLIILILIACTACDRVTKSYAYAALRSAPPVSLLNDSIRIEYTENTGAILGLGANLPSQARFLFLVVFAGVILAVTLFYAFSTGSCGPIQLMGLSLVAAGGLGNLLDRIFNAGVVIDFIRLGVGPLRTGIFNVADVAIVAGTITFVLFSAKDKPRA